MCIFSARKPLYAKIIYILEDISKVCRSQFQSVCQSDKRNDFLYDWGYKSLKYEVATCM